MKVFTDGCVFLAVLGLALSAPRVAQADPVRIFSPGVGSGMAGGMDPVFEPDCGGFYFVRSNGDDAVILYSSRAGKSWKSPQLAPFSGAWRDIEPALSPDGTQLTFSSNRPTLPGGAALEGSYKGAIPQSGGNLWKVTRNKGKWSQPQRLPDLINSSDSVFSPSVSADGSLYFMKPDAAGGVFHLYRAQWRDGEFEAPQRLSFSNGELGDFDPAVAADESFLVFSSSRPPAQPGKSALFLVVRKGSDWGEPVPLIEKLGADVYGIEAKLSPEGRTLYFTNNRVEHVTFPKGPEGTRDSLRAMEVWNGPQRKIWQVDLTPVLREYGVSVSTQPKCPLS
jgi:Tol biopolymer transport system component